MTTDLGMPTHGGSAAVDPATPPPERHRRRAPPRRRHRADEEGLHLRPGGALVPRLRRLRHPRRRAGLPARARPQAREHRLRLGHRVLLALPLLPRHLRHALDPRPRPRDRDGAGRDPRGPLGLGRDRRRRRALDRWQPPHPRAAPQRQPQDPALQQRDLRPDEGAVLPHLARRPGDEVDAARLARHPLQPGVARPRRRGELRRAHDGLRPPAPDGGAPRRGRAPRLGARRDLPELPDLQRRRLRRAQGPHRGGGTHPAPHRRRAGRGRRHRRRP